jgi:ssDNA-binding Zn-finger/Zn-ribbon topoisomerase 1
MGEQMYESSKQENANERKSKDCPKCGTPMIWKDYSKTDWYLKESHWYCPKCKTGFYKNYQIQGETPDL